MVNEGRTTKSGDNSVPFATGRRCRDDAISNDGNEAANECSVPVASNMKAEPKGEWSPSGKERGAASCFTVSLW